MKRALLLVPFVLALTTLTYAQFTFTSLDFPGADRTRTYGINSHGTIVGAYGLPGETYHAMMFKKGKFIPLAPTTILGTNHSLAFKINDRGDVAGTFFDDNGYGHGFLLSKGVVTILDFPGASETYAYGLNQHGTIAGYWDILDAYGNTLSISGFTWNNGNFSEVTFPGAGFTEVAGINAHGDLVGMWGPDPNLPVGHGFLYSQARGQFTSFDAFLVVSSSHATQADDINGIGNIVGQYWSGNGTHHGFLKVGNDFTHIEFPGAYQTTPWGINSSLQIVGNWYESDGRAHGWLAQPGQQ